MASYVLGIDIGGTFTDIVLYDRRNAVHHTRTVLTTPDDPARGVIAGLTELLEGRATWSRGSDGSGPGRAVISCLRGIRPKGGCKGRGVCD